MIKAVTVGFAALVLLAGCSSSKPAKRETTAAIKSSPISPTPSPSATYASVAQWASYVANHETPVVKADQSMQGCTMAADARSCLLTGLTFVFTTETLEINFETAERPDVLGTPPPELADLVEQTKAALTAMQPADDKQVKCGVSTTPGCLQTDLAWDQAHDDVMAALNGWKPYIGG